MPLEQLQALANSGGGVLAYPRGTFSESVVVNIPPNVSVEIRGEGSDASVAQGSLRVNYGNQFSSLKARGITFAATSPNAGDGLTLNMDAFNGNPALAGQTILEDVVFRGSDGYQGSNYFSRQIVVRNVSNVNYDTVSLIGDTGRNGIGVYITGIPELDAFAVVQNFQKLTAFGLGRAVLFGPHVQGVTVNQSNLTANRDHIATEPGMSMRSVLIQLGIMNSQLGDGRAIVADSLISGLQMLNNQIGYGPDTEAITGALVGSTIAFNFFTCGIARNNCAIHIKANGASRIVNNVITGAQTGIRLDEPTEQIRVLENNYNNVITPVDNRSTKNLVTI